MNDHRNRNVASLATRVAKIGMSVLFSLCAFASTAHALSAKDLLVNTNLAGTEAVQKLDAIMKHNAGGVRVVIVDLAKLSASEKASIGAATSDAERANKTRAFITRQIKADPDIDRALAKELTEALKTGFADGGINLAALKNEDPLWYQALYLGKGVKLGVDTKIAKPADQISIVFANTNPKIFADSALSNYLGPEWQGLYSVMNAAHEATHASQGKLFAEKAMITAETQKIIGDGNPLDWNTSAKLKGPEGKANLEKMMRLTELARIQIENERQIEAEADVRGFEGVMKVAKTEAEGLYFCKAWMKSRILEALAVGDGRYVDQAHFTVPELSQFIHKYDPSFPVVAFDSPDSMQAALKQCQISYMYAPAGERHLAFKERGNMSPSAAALTHLYNTSLSGSPKEVVAHQDIRKTTSQRPRVAMNRKVHGKTI